MRHAIVGVAPPAFDPEGAGLIWIPKTCARIGVRRKAEQDGGESLFHGDCHS
jgi:hypothetical protein